MPEARLIERWLPIAALSEESVRERRSMTALPPIYYLHVWWARRPLVAARAAVLASLLPGDTDRKKFMEVLGIHGDPVESRSRIDRAKKSGVRFEGEAYSYDRAFSYCPTKGDKEWVFAQVGSRSISVVDPTAGGGSIPFESRRLGLTTFANDLNPVSATILNATVDLPFRFGLALVDEFKTIGAEYLKRREALLQRFFPPEPSVDSVATNYLWARTISCPYCAGRIPLSPNWRLGPDGSGLRLVPNVQAGPNSPGRSCKFQVVQREDEQSEATVADADSTCCFPDCRRVIDSQEVKRQAMAGEMGEQLFAVVFKTRVETKTKSGRKGKPKWIRGYRASRDEDELAPEVLTAMQEQLAEWKALDILPSETLPMNTESWTHGNTPAQYGATTWSDLFTPRQLYCHGASVSIFRDLVDEDRRTGALTEIRSAAYVYLAFSIDKLIDYNSRSAAWHAGREVIEHTFRDHAFPLKWSFAELGMLVEALGKDWAIEQTAKCIKEFVSLTGVDEEAESLFRNHEDSDPLAPVTVTCGPGENLGHLVDGSVDAVIMDPPYGANVMYSELSDFFYVWMKRTVAYLHPEHFTRLLTDKDSEAVVNVARFDRAKGAAVLANRDYRERMQSIFSECRRILKPSGIMTVMFTHKGTGAWDALTTGLIEAGFSITASWPVHTEAEDSMHIKKKAAAKSTIFLVCRPRVIAPTNENSYWEDIEPLVAKAVRTKIEEFQRAGVSGVDLYLACFGPALEEFSKHWPLKRGIPRPEPQAKKRRKQAELFEEAFDPYAVTPEDALEAARREVKTWRLNQLTHMGSKADLDPATSFYVLAWDAFKAPVFPYDEALRLARAVGADLDQLIGRVCEKKGADIKLWDSGTRASKGSLGAGDGTRGMIDALQVAAHRARTRNLEAAREFLDSAGLSNQPLFLNALEALLEVLPPSKTFAKVDFSGDLQAASDDFDALEKLRRLAFATSVDEPKQLKLWSEEAA